MEDTQLFDVVMTPRLSNGQKLGKSLLDAIGRVYSAARSWARIGEAARRRRALSEPRRLPLGTPVP